MNRIAIVYHSKNGHTKSLAENILLGCNEITDDVNLIDCTSNIDWNYLDSCDAIIFGCPTYMGSVSAEMKSFMDKSSPSFLKQKWKNKLAAAFTNSSALNGDKLSTLMQLSIFAFQHGMLWIGLDLPAGISSTKHTQDQMNRLGSWIGLMAQSNSDESAHFAPPKSDLKTARYFGKRIAIFAKKLGVQHD